MWHHSCVATAQALYAAYGGRALSFYHKGSDLFESMESTFIDVNNKEDRPFGKRDKWNPADIYVAAPSVAMTKTFDCFDDFNHHLLKLAKTSDLVSVSLKQVPKGRSAVLKKVNYTPERQVHTYRGYTIGKTNFFDSMDVTVLFDEGNKIQFKSDGKTWQGEVLKVTSGTGGGKAGRIGSEVLGGIIKRFTGDQLVGNGPAKLRAAEPNDRYYSDFYAYYRDCQKDGRPMTKTAFLEELAKKDVNWAMSKYQSAQLICYLKDARRRDAAITNIVNYGMSSMDLSGPHVKVLS